MPVQGKRDYNDRPRDQLNRFGERNVKASASSYEDERGMRHIEPEEAWENDLRSEGHRGKGPKGYRRSDERVREEICEALAAHPDLDASEMQVSVSEGLVTLEGVVEHKADRRRAEDICDAVFGVRDVHNHLSVRRRVDGWVPGLREVDREREHDVGPGLLKGLY